jgi:hypothetical protein
MGRPHFTHDFFGGADLVEEDLLERGFGELETLQANAAIDQCFEQLLRVAARPQIGLQRSVVLAYT